METPAVGTKGKFIVVNLKTGTSRKVKKVPPFKKGGDYLLIDQKFDETVVTPQSDPPGGCADGCSCTDLGGGVWRVRC